MQEMHQIRPAYARFIRPQMQNGKDVNAIYRLFQDRIGFVWVGTQYGLFRLDGSEARAFRADPDNRDAISGMFITAIGENLQGHLLVGTYESGPSIYDPSLERFSPLDLDFLGNNDRIMRSTINTADGRTWIGTLGSLTEVDFERGYLRKHFHPRVEDFNLIGENLFTALFCLDERTLLVGTGSGAFLFDIRTYEFRYLPFHEPRLPNPGSHNIVSITGTENEAILATPFFPYRLNRDLERLDMMEPHLNDRRRDRHFRITALESDSTDGRLWVGSIGGLFRYEGTERGWYEFPYDESDASAPSGPQVQALMRDRSGMLWVGGGDGVSLLDLRYNFRYHRIRSADDSVSIRVNGFARGDGTLWIGTHKGLYEYDEETGAKVRHSLDTEERPETRDGRVIRTIYRGRDATWLATDVGLFQWDGQTRSLRNSWFSHPMKDDPPTGPYVLGVNVKGAVEDSDGQIWSGSDGRGMQRLNPSTGLFTYYRIDPSRPGALPNETLLVSLRDDRDRMWFGFAGGLALYDSQRDVFRSFQHEKDDPFSLDNNVVSALHQDADGTIWVGTAGGLNRLEEQEDGTIRFFRCRSRHAAIRGPVLCIVSCDDDLWLGTNDGILRVEKNRDDFSVRVYNVQEGPSLAACYCAFRNEDGYLYFGGADGFDSFHPDRLQPDTLHPTVVLTEVRLFNRPVPVIPPAERDDGTFALECASPVLKHLELSYRESVVTFRYAALHYRQSSSIRYSWKLDGFDRHWTEAGNRTEATYTNLNPGDYVFRVRAENADGLLSRNQVALALRVSPPPWRTWWAHSLYGVAGAGVVAAFTRWRISLRERELREKQRLQQAREEERESIRRQNAADFHDEAGTTLTRILFLTELARRRGDNNEELQGMLENIDANTTRLAQGMRDFIWVLDPDKDTLLDTLQRIETAGESLFGPQGISFSMSYDHQQLRDVTLELNQRRQTLMICKEALNNAARHAHAKSILVRAARGDDGIEISIADDGDGFNADAVVSGYGMKSMRARSDTMHAQLTVSSTPGDGTSVHLKIPHVSN